MTDWTNPRTWTVAELVTKAMLDTHLRDNSLYLKEQIDAAGTLTDLIHLTNRQGGSSTNWSQQGTTNYVPSDFKMEIGMGSVTSISTSTGTGLYYGTTTITFPSAFSQAPFVMVMPFSGSYDLIRINAYGSSTTTANIQAVAHSSISFPGSPFAWIAIGQA